MTRGGGGVDPNFICPYRFRTAWEYADVERVGWQWVYDHSANLICPVDPCSVTKCGFHASCTIVGNQGICACDVGYNQGNPYKVNKKIIFITVKLHTPFDNVLILFYILQL